MMIRSSYVLIVGFCCAATSALGQEHQQGFNMGYGVGTCAQFAQEYQANIYIEASYFNWAQGFMSGMNDMFSIAKVSTKDLNAMSVNDQRAEVRNYCSVHPLDAYWMAVSKLYFELPDIPLPKAVSNN